MKKPHWIDRSALILLHAESLSQHGGLPGLRDEAVLDASLARPQHVFAYEAPCDAARLAAAYCYGLVRNHPFHDGNKRAGFLALGLFLALNGFDLNVDQAEAVETIFQLAAGRLREDALAKWVRKHMQRLP